MTKTTDWEIRFNKKFYFYDEEHNYIEHFTSQSGNFTCSGRAVDMGKNIKDFIRQEIESARREVIDEISKKSFEDDNGCYGKIIRMDDVLSALRKEEV